MDRSMRKVDRKLATHFKPVKPDPAFVADLRLELDDAMHRRIRVNKMKKGILVAGGIVGAAVMIVTIVRSLTSWEEFTQTVSKLLSGKEREHQTASV